MSESEWKERERRATVRALVQQETQQQKKMVEWCIWNWINTRNEKKSHE